MKEFAKAFRIVTKLLKAASAPAPSTGNSPPQSGKGRLQIPREYLQQYQFEDIAFAAWRSKVIEEEDLETLERMLPDRRAIQKLPAEDNPLVYAAAVGKLKSVEKLLALGADVNSRDDMGFTPLMGSAVVNSVPMAQLFLSRGAKPHLKDSSGANAMHFAGPRGNIEMYQLLHQAGVPLNAKDNDGYTPLDYLGRIERGQGPKPEARKYMIELGCTYSYGSPFIPDSPPVVESEVMSSHFSVRSIEPPLGPNALTNAACLGEADRVSELLAAGVNPGHHSGDAAPPLINAVMFRHFDVVKMLLEAGAQVDLPDKDGTTALFYAVDTNDPSRDQPDKIDQEFVKLLLQHGADPDKTNSNGFSPRQWAELSQRKAWFERVIKSAGKEPLRDTNP